MFDIGVWKIAWTIFEIVGHSKPNMTNWYFLCIYIQIILHDGVQIAFNEALYML